MTPRKLIFLCALGFPIGLLAGMGFIFLANELFYAYAAFATVIGLQAAFCLLLVFTEYRGAPVSDDGVIRQKEIP